MWNTFLYYPIINLLVFFYQISFQNLGLAIIALTIFLRLLLVPLTIPSLRAAKKQQELRPQLEKLKQKHGNDREKMAKAQLELYRQHGINPAAGCLPQILQIVILIALYQAFMRLLNADGQAIAELNKILYFDFLKIDLQRQINTTFGPWDLTRPDPFLVLPALAGICQFVLSKMMMPAAQKGQQEAKKTPEKSDDLLYTMQSQSLYLMPLMTVLIGWQLPSGLVLYWLVTTLFSLAQQYFLVGIGGLKSWRNFLKSR